MEAAAVWLAEKLPPGDEGVLIHNDLKFDNIVLDPTLQSGASISVVGVLDWEMATVGHPLMDLGTTLSYWLTPDDGPELAMMPFGVSGYLGAWTRERLVGQYGEATGRDVATIDFYHVFGLFKTAVVAQQIYYRFHQGKTDDPRFQMMIVGVNVLARLAARIISKSTL
jgi:aminoglycoside phosphotransferase (APT) family kinase protein